MFIFSLFCWNSNSDFNIWMHFAYDKSSKGMVAFSFWNVYTLDAIASSKIRGIQESR